MESSMAATTKKQVSNHIPQDLAFDILFKLPIKSLKRFTCVSKFWAELFEKPHFINLFRKHNLSLSESDNSRLLLNHKQPFYVYDETKILYLLSGNTFANSVKLDWPPPFDGDHERISIVGSIINGILCLCQGYGEGTTDWNAQKVVLWNPSTEEFKVIPDGIFDHRILEDFPLASMIEDLDYMSSSVNIYGFGYDHVADDYKLIRYFGFCLDFRNRGPYDKALWQIYSLRSNCWRDLNVELPNHSSFGYLNPGTTLSFNGVCHWLGFDDHNRRDMLVSFNLSDEVFITTPFIPNHRKIFWKHLVVLNGNIATIERGDEKFYFDISILGEFGVAESWTKIFSFGPLPGGGLETIGIGKNDDIFYIKENYEIARFNLNTEENEEIGVAGHSNCQMLIYDESFFPIGG